MYKMIINQSMNFGKKPKNLQKTMLFYCHVDLWMA